MHLLSIYATHPVLRDFVRLHLFAAQSDRPGTSTGSDRVMEFANDDQKERNLSSSVMDSLHFTRYLQPMMHVYRTWKSTMNGGASGDIGFRPSMQHEVNTLVEFFLAEMGTDLRTHTDDNRFHHTGNPVNMRSAPMKLGRPWEYQAMVQQGRSHGWLGEKAEHWWEYTLRHIRDHQFFQ